MIVRDGYVVREWGNVMGARDWASASKPVMSTLLFFAVEENRCATTTRVGELLSGGSPKDSAITFHHLTNMTSGYSRGEGPGEAWAYNDHAINLYGFTLFHRVFGDDPDTILSDRLAFLGFEDDVVVSDSRYGRITGMSIRDFARIGLFWLRRGIWGDDRRLPDAAFDLVTSQVPAFLPITAEDGPESWDLGTFGGPDDQLPWGPGHYGYNFWVNGSGLWPDVPPDVFQANGHWGGEVCTVLPGLGIVAVGVGDWGHPSTPALRLLVEAATPAVSAEAAAGASSWGRVKSRFR